MAAAKKKTKTAAQEDDTIAPFWKRAISFAIDVVLVWMFLLTPFWTLIRKATPGEDFSQAISFLAEHPKSVVSMNMITVFLALVVLAYFMILQHVTGSTIGMLTMRLRVKSLHNHSNWWQMLVRNLFLIPFFPFIMFLITEPVSLILSKGKYRLLEKLSKTRTVMITAR